MPISEFLQTSRFRSIQNNNNGLVPPNKKSRISQACVICRKKKIKCNGARPSCGYCLESGFPCMYSAPKRRGPPRKMPVLNGDTENPTRSTSSTSTSTPPKKSKYIHRKKGLALPLSVNSQTSIGLETPEELARNIQTSCPPPNGNSNSDHGFSGKTASNSNSTSHPSHLNHSGLTNEVTFLLSCNKIGRVCFLKTLGPSNGMQYLSQFTPNFQNGIFTMERSDFPTLFGKDSINKSENLDPYELPPPFVQDAMCNFYFDYLRPFFPLFDKEQVRMYRDDSNRSKRNHFVLHSFYAFCSLWHYRLRKRSEIEFSCFTTHLKKAKLLFSNVCTDAPTLNNLCALLLLAFTECGDLESNSWMYTGMAIRMAQDMGLHLEFQQLSIQSKFLPLQLTRGKLAWWCCYYLDRMHSIFFGRKCAIHDDDIDQLLQNAFSDSQGEKRESNGTEKSMPPKLLPYLTEPDLLQPIIPDFLTLLRLMHIQGRISNFLNSMDFLDVNQIHMHSLLLEKWLADLPPHLQFLFQTRQASSPFALHLNLIYYFTVLILYQPSLRSRPEYPATFKANATSICFTTIKAILVILEASHHLCILSSLSFYVVQSLLVCATSLYIIFVDPCPSYSPQPVTEFASKIIEFLNEILSVWSLLRPLIDLHSRMLQSMSSTVPLPSNSSISNSPQKPSFLPGSCSQSYNLPLEPQISKAMGTAPSPYPKHSPFQTTFSSMDSNSTAPSSILEYPMLTSVTPTHSQPSQPSQLPSLPTPSNHDIISSFAVPQGHASSTTNFPPPEMKYTAFPSMLTSAIPTEPPIAIPDSSPKPLPFTQPPPLTVYHKPRSHFVSNYLNPIAPSNSPTPLPSFSPPNYFNCNSRYLLNSDFRPSTPMSMRSSTSMSASISPSLPSVLHHSSPHLPKDSGASTPLPYSSNANFTFHPPSTSTATSVSGSKLEPSYHYPNPTSTNPSMLKSIDHEKIGFLDPKYELEMTRQAAENAHSTSFSLPPTTPSSSTSSSSPSNNSHPPSLYMSTTPSSTPSSSSSSTSSSSASASTYPNHPDSSSVFWSPMPAASEFWDPASNI